MPALVTLVKGPRPPAFHGIKLGAFVTGELDKEANVQLLLRNRITATWRGEKPAFIKVTGRQGSPGNPQKFFMEIRIGGPEHGRKKYYWLNLGTKVRYAHMTPDFQSKTVPRFIGSRSGRGGFDRLSYPLPGIVARKWDETIRMERQPKLTISLKNAVGDAFT